MKQSHKEILDKIEKYLDRPGSEHLRFWQALFNMNIVEFKSDPQENGNYQIKDDHNISDEKLLKRIY